MPQMGSTATGSIRALPSFCRVFIIEKILLRFFSPPVSRQHAYFLRPSAHNGLYGQNLLCQLDDGVPRLDGVAYVGLKLRKIIAVADEHGSDGIQARLLQHIQVHLDEQVALFDLLAVLSVDGEALALETYGFQAHMDQDLRAAVGNHGDGVTGFEHHVHGAVTGGADLSLGGDHGDAVAQHTGGEGGIGDLRHRHSLAGHRGADLIVFLTEELGKKTHWKNLPFCAAAGQKKAPILRLLDGAGVFALLLRCGGMCGGISTSPLQYHIVHNKSTIM